MFAQLPDPNSAQAIGWLAVAFFGLAAGIHSVLKLVDRARGKTSVQQPFDVRIIDTMAREKDCSDRHQSAEKQIAEIRGARAEDARQASISRKAIYEETRRVGIESRAHVESVRSELSAQINEIPLQIVTLLRNTGAIGGGKQ